MIITARIRSTWAFALGVLAATTIVTESALAQVQELPIVGHIGGQTVAIASEGNYVYFGSGTEFRILDVSDPSTPQPVGLAFLPGSVSDIALKGNYAYVSDSRDNIHIFEVSNPESPREVWTETSARGAGKLDIQGDILATGTTRILSIENPAMLVELGAIGIVGGEGVAISGDFVFVASGNQGLRVVDISDPSMPQEVASLATAFTAHQVEIKDGYAYVANSFSLWVVDVTDPTAPTDVVSFPMPDATSVTISGNIAFVTAGGSILWIFDISTPQAPIKLSEVLPTDGFAFKVAVSGSHALVADHRGVRVIDVSNPSLPSQVGFFESFTEARSSSISGNQLFVAGADVNGLVSVDVTDPSQPVLDDILGIPLGDPQEIQVVGLHAYLANGNVNGAPALHIFDVSDPLSLVELSDLPLAGNPVSVFIEGPYAYIAAGEANQMLIVDVSDPANPVQVSAFSLPGIANGVFVSEGVAYVADNVPGLVIVDIRNPSSPIELSTINTPGEAVKVDVVGDFAYVADSTQGLRIIDVADKANPLEVGLFNTGDTTNNVVVSEQMAFVSYDIGLRVLDIGDPSQVMELAFFRSAGVTKAATIGRFGYVSDEAGGLFVLAIPPPPPILSPVPSPFIDADTVTINGTATAGSFVTVGGGVLPLFQQLAEGATAFSLTVELKQEAINTISVTTMNEFGLVSLPAIARVVEGVAYPSTVETITALAVTPDPAANVPLDGTLAFTCTATFSDSSMADVSQFVQWEDISNGEVITPGGLYVNTKAGLAQIRAFVAGIFSSSVSVGDGL